MATFTDRHLDFILNALEGFGSASIQLLLPLLQATFDTENISSLNTLNLARQKPCHILL